MQIRKRPGDTSFNYVWGWVGIKFLPVQPLAGFSIPEGAEVELWYSNRPPSSLEVQTGTWGRPGGSLPLSELPKLPDRKWITMAYPITHRPFNPASELQQ